MHPFSHNQKPMKNGIRETSPNKGSADNSQLNLAMKHQDLAELWQNIAKQQQEIAALLQYAAFRQRALIAQGTETDDKVLESEFHRFEEDLLRLIDSAFALEGLALRQVELAIKQTEDALHL